jgi:hypothetical protein
MVNMIGRVFVITQRKRESSFWSSITLPSQLQSWNLKWSIFLIYNCWRDDAILGLVWQGPWHRILKLTHKYAALDNTHFQPASECSSPKSLTSQTHFPWFIFVAIWFLDVIEGPLQLPWKAFLNPHSWKALQVIDIKNPISEIHIHTRTLRGMRYQQYCTSPLRTHHNVQHLYLTIFW